MAKNLVIVESPAKAKTIKRFLGKDFVVEASMGHIRDLPSSGLGVDVENDFEPTYEVSEGKTAVVKKLRDHLKTAETLWIATDEDREGEAIGWHLTQALKIKNPGATKRIVFHEITEEAIKEAVANPRTLDMRLVHAQQARRILDRLVGYTLSPFLWKKVYSGLSAGRVQSVAVRIIVDREREIQAFVAQEYWSLEALLQTDKKEAFSASLERKNGEKFELTNKEDTDTVLKALEGASFKVTSTEEKEVQRNPAAPFTTSTLQQEASRKLGFSVKQTMVVAQQLYEGVSLGKGEGQGGLITYMRTDSVNLSNKALADAKETIQKLYGREYVLSEPRTYKNKSKGAQEAHEAIRPTELSRTPESVAGVLDHQQLKLYTLIWNRTLATQMPPAEFRRIAADITADIYTFRATGQTLLFDGFMRVYMEDRDEDDTGAAEDGDKLLPPLAEGDALACEELKPEQHFTKPPARYTEASLVKKLEEEGIGRPSTYAPTISVVQQRGYVRKEGRNLFPETIAFTVTDLLTEHFPQVTDLAFTAKMEDSLDEIAEGKVEEKIFLKDFYNPFKLLVDSKTKEIKKTDVLKEYVVGIDPETKLEVLARTGRFGPYVQLGRLEVDEKGKKKKSKKGEGPRTASLPKTANPEDTTLEQALALLAFPKVLGQHNGADVSVILGRFGPYLKSADGTAALRDIDPSTVTLPQALELIAGAAEAKKKAAEPLKVLGKDPNSGGEIQVKDGRFGPYVTDGKTNASLGKKFTPDSITFEDAVEVLLKKRTSPKRAWRGKKKAE